MIWLASNFAAAGIALLIVAAIKKFSAITWTQALIVYLMAWTIFFDGRILRDAYETHQAARAALQDTTTRGNGK